MVGCSKKPQVSWWYQMHFYVLSFYQHCICFSHIFLKGGSGQRKTTSLAQDSQGYTTKISKASSNNRKNVIYIVPLQEEIDITLLPYDAPEFHNMPKNICMTCGASVPLQLLPCHLEDCQSNQIDLKVSLESTIIG